MRTNERGEDRMSERVIALVTGAIPERGYAFCDVPGVQERVFIHARDTDQPSRPLTAGDQIEGRVLHTNRGARLIDGSYLT